MRMMYTYCHKVSVIWLRSSKYSEFTKSPETFVFGLFFLFRLTSVGHSRQRWKQTRRYLSVYKVCENSSSRTFLCRSTLFQRPSLIPGLWPVYIRSYKNEVNCFEKAKKETPQNHRTFPTRTGHSRWHPVYETEPIYIIAIVPYGLLALFFAKRPENKKAPKDRCLSLDAVCTRNTLIAGTNHWYLCLYYTSEGRQMQEKIFAHWPCFV